MRGRKPVPTHLKLVTGNPGKRPLNTSEPIAPPAIPKPPRYLSKAARREWRALAPILKDAGVLSHLDAIAFGLLASAIARTNEAERMIAERGMTVTSSTGVTKVAPWVHVASKSGALVVQLCSEFGLTPSARTRVKVDLRPKQDAFAAYLERGRHKSPVSWIPEKPI